MGRAGECDHTVDCGALSATVPSYEDIWSGPLTPEAVKAIADSPCRHDLADSLLDGATAVWILLKNADSEANRVAEEMLNAQLAEWEGRSPVEAEDPTQQDAPGLSFTTLSLQRDNPDEAFFVKMLLHTEPDLVDYDEPMAFPVFGRGRVLYALIGAGINKDTIDDACAFMGSACSCIVKDQNPGTDLLLAANWEEAYPAEPIVTVETVEPLAVAETPEPPPIPEVTDRALPVWVYVTFALVVVFSVQAGVLVAAIRRKRREAHDSASALGTSTFTFVHRPQKKTAYVSTKREI